MWGKGSALNIMYFYEEMLYYLFLKVTTQVGTNLEQREGKR